MLWIGGLFCLWAAGGCGYQLAGSGQLPKGIVKLFVAEPGNRTSESQLISIISNELKNELTRRRVQLMDLPQGADGILEEEITSLADATITRRGETTALEKRLTIQMDLKLENADGKIVWMAKGVSADETYPIVNGSDMATMSNRKDAIYRLAKRLAEDIYNRLTADF